MAQGSKGSVLLRQWHLLKSLQTRGEGIPLNDLAEQFDVTTRTIQRDFEILQELGFPITHDTDDFGKRYWRMPPDFFKTGPLVLTLTEAVSLHLADRLLMSLSPPRSYAERVRILPATVPSLTRSETLG